MTYREPPAEAHEGATVVDPGHPPAPADAPTSAARPSRRRALQWAWAGGAAAAGAGLAWWRIRPHAVTSGEGAEAEAARAGAGGLWGRSFDTPEGTPLALAGLRGQPLLVNFWATWCPPCVEEMPALDRFYRAHRARGLQVVGLAIDQPSAVAKFLQRSPVAFPIGLAGFAGTELARALGNEGDKMPFSVVLDRAGQVTHRKIGQITPADFAAWAALP